MPNDSPSGRSHNGTLPNSNGSCKWQYLSFILSALYSLLRQSLALALYFASRGQGQIRATPESIPVPYTSTARVLLNGLGSDELLGGYGRHRSVYNNGGWPAVISEVRKLRRLAHSMTNTPVPSAARRNRPHTNAKSGKG